MFAAQLYHLTAPNFVKKHLNLETWKQLIWENWKGICLFVPIQKKGTKNE